MSEEKSEEVTVIFKDPNEADRAKAFIKATEADEDHLFPYILIVEREGHVHSHSNLQPYGDKGQEGFVINFLLSIKSSKPEEVKHPWTEKGQKTKQPSG